MDKNTGSTNVYTVLTERKQKNKVIHSSTLKLEEAFNRKAVKFRFPGIFKNSIQMTPKLKCYQRSKGNEVCSVCGSKRYSLPDKERASENRKKRQDRDHRAINRISNTYPKLTQIGLTQYYFSTLPVLNETAAGLSLLLFLSFGSQSPKNV